MLVSSNIVDRALMMSAKSSPNKVGAKFRASPQNAKLGETERLAYVSTKPLTTTRPLLIISDSLRIIRHSIPLPQLLIAK